MGWVGQASYEWKFQNPYNLPPLEAIGAVDGTFLSLGSGSINLGRDDGDRMLYSQHATPRTWNRFSTPKDRDGTGLRDMETWALASRDSAL